MPFDIAPRTDVSIHKQFADAMLRGCAVTEPHQGSLCSHVDRSTCALGAVIVGFGRDVFEEADPWGPFEHLYAEVNYDYRRRYGCNISTDNDAGNYTREEIAARIAALK